MSKNNVRYIIIAVLLIVAVGVGTFYLREDTDMYQGRFDKNLVKLFPNFRCDENVASVVVSDVVSEVASEVTSIVFSDVTSDGGVSQVPSEVTSLVASEVTSQVPQCVPFQTGKDKPKKNK